MKLKKIFLGLVAAAATVGLASTTINAAENGLREDFNYSADGVGELGGSNAYNIYARSKAPNEVCELVQVDGKDVLHFGTTQYGSKVDGTPTDAVYKLQIRDNASTGSVFNMPGKSAVIKTSYKTVRTYSKCFYLYSAEMGTIQITNIKGLAANTWHDLTVVISEENNKVYAYADGSLIQEIAIASGKDWTGSLNEIGFQAGKANFAYEEGFYIDYIDVAEYTPVTATVAQTKEVEVGSNFELAPELSGEAALPQYNVVISDETKLTYSEGKFWGQAEGEVTVTFDFVDTLISDVTTTVNVKAAAAEIVVSDISINELFTSGLTLTAGQSLPLDKLFTALPAAASNKELAYTVTEGADCVNIADGKITAVKAGNVKLTVAATDSAAYSEIFDIVVKAGNFASLNDYALTDSWLDPVAPENLTYQGWEPTEYTGTYARVFTDITVIEDELFGNVIKYEGVGSSASNEGTATGGAALVKHISASELNANKDYKITGWAKVDTTGDQVAPKTRVDVKIYAYKLVDGKPSYLSGAPYSVQMTSLSNFANTGWTYFELGNVNLDTTVCDGFKIELITWNCQNNTTAYITNVAFEELDTVTNVSYNVTAGDQAITNETVELTLGSTLQLNAVAVPSASVLPSLTYTSSDTSIVTVDANGLITAVAPGQASVTITDGKKNITLNLNIANKATNVELANPTLELEVGGYEELPLVVTPSNSTSLFTATVEGEGVVASIEAGNILAILANQVGTYSVVITSNDNVEVSFTLTVVVTEVKASDLSVNADSTSILTGETYQILATVTPADRPVTYVSSDVNIATVDANGLVTAVKAGTVTITVTADELSKTVTITITDPVVVIPATSVSVDKAEVTLNVEGTHQIVATVNPTDTTDTVTYKSSDASVATVDANGLVTAVKAGKAVITVTAGEKTTTVTVTVSAPKTGCAGSLVGATTALSALATVVFLAKKRRKED